MFGFKGSVFLAALLFFGGCTSKSEISIVEVQRRIAKGERAEALEELRRVVQSGTDQELAVEASRVGAQLAHFQMKRYDAAIEFYVYLANYSPLLDEKISSLKYLSQILIDHARDFERAVEILEKLLTMKIDPAERFNYRLQLAKANYQLARVDQAQVELDTLKSEKDIGPLKYDLDLFESHILVSQKQFSEAASILKNLIRDYPARSKVDGLKLNLVSSYEDMGDLDAAIQTMENMKEEYPDPQFLELRISRLKERKKNQPGAKGLRK